MKVFEKVLWSVVLLGLLLKIFHLPFSSLFLVLGLSTLSMSYLFAGWFMFASPTRKDQDTATSILTGLALSVLVLGLLFKVQVWPFASFYLLLSIPFTGVMLAVLIITRRGKPELNRYYNAMTLRTAPLLLAAVIIYPIDERNFLDYYYSDRPGKAALLDSIIHTDDPSLKQKLYGELETMDRAAEEEKLSSE